MVKVINKQKDMIIPSRKGGVLSIRKGEASEVSVGDLQRLLSIYGKSVEIVKEKISEKVVEVKVTEPVKHSEVRRKTK